MADPDEDNEVKLVSLELNHIGVFAFLFPKYLCRSWIWIGMKVFGTIQFSGT